MTRWAGKRRPDPLRVGRAPAAYRRALEAATHPCRLLALAARTVLRLARRPAPKLPAPRYEAALRNSLAAGAEPAGATEPARIDPTRVGSTRVEPPRVPPARIQPARVERVRDADREPSAGTTDTGEARAAVRSATRARALPAQAPLHLLRGVAPPRPTADAPPVASPAAAPVRAAPVTSAQPRRASIESVSDARPARHPAPAPDAEPTPDIHYGQLVAGRAAARLQSGPSSSAAPDVAQSTTSGLLADSWAVRLDGPRATAESIAAAGVAAGWWESGVQARSAMDDGAAVPGTARTAQPAAMPAAGLAAARAAGTAYPPPAGERGHDERWPDGADLAALAAPPAHVPAPAADQRVVEPPATTDHPVIAGHPAPAGPHRIAEPATPAGRPPVGVPELPPDLTDLAAAMKQVLDDAARRHGIEV